MLTIFEKADLAKALKPLTGVMGRGKCMEQLKFIRLTATGDTTVTMVATNGEQRTSIDVAAAADGIAALIEGQALSNIAAAAPDGAQIEFEPAGGHINVRAGRARWKVPALSVENAALFDVTDPAGNAFTLPADEWQRIADLVAPYISTDQGRYYLCGVYLTRLDGRLHAVGTDGHRMTRMTLADADGVDLPDGGIIVPREFWNAARHLSDGVAMHLTCDDRAMAVTAGDVTLSTKLIAGDYPEQWQAVCPPPGEDSVRFQCSAMLSCLAGAGAVAPAGGGAVRLTPGDGALRVECTSDNGGEFSETIDAEITGSPATRLLSISYLRDWLDRQPAGAVTMSDPATGAGAVLFTHPGIGDARHVIMPMRDSVAPAKSAAA